MLPERYRIPARVIVVFLAYGLYLMLAGDGIVRALFVAVGTLLLAFAAIDRLTIRRQDRSQVLATGTIVLGLGLLGIGLYLVLR